MRRGISVAGFVVLVAGLVLSGAPRSSVARQNAVTTPTQFFRAPSDPASLLFFPDPSTADRDPSSVGEAEREANPASSVVVHGPGKQRLPRKAFDGPLPRFIQRTVTEEGGNEPSVAFGAGGSLFWAGFVVGDYYPADVFAPLFRSADGGMTWKENIPQIAGVPFNNQGGDPYLYRDPITGRLFYLLYWSGGSHIAWTDDEGETWGRPVQLRVHDQGPTDYPKLWTSRPAQGSTTAAGADFYVHLCYNAGLQMACERSIDGGNTFQPSPSPYPEAYLDSQTNGCFGLLPGWAISSPKDGTIYMPKAHCGKLEVAVSKDNGLTWERIEVADDVQDSSTPCCLGSEARLAIDKSGNLYFFAMAGGGDDAGGKKAILSISRDGGDTWSEAWDVTAPGLTAVKYPSIVAGDDGRIAFFYMGAAIRGGWNASEKHMDNARWDGYVGFSLDALRKRPAFATATVNPADDPLRRGPCRGRCSDPNDCVYDCSISASAIGIFDYLQIALDPTSGRVATSLVDLCAGKCGTPEGTSEDPLSFIGAVGIQVKGPSLFRGR